MKKAKTKNKVVKKSIKEWMKARSPLLLNMELIAAVNKVFWENLVNGSNQLHVKQQWS